MATKTPIGAEPQPEPVKLTRDQMRRSNARRRDADGTAFGKYVSIQHSGWAGTLRQGERHLQSNGSYRIKGTIYAPASEWYFDPKEDPAGLIDCFEIPQVKNGDVSIDEVVTMMEEHPQFGKAFIRMEDFEAYRGELKNARLAKEKADQIRQNLRNSRQAKMGLEPAIS